MHRLTLAAAAVSMSLASSSGLIAAPFEFKSVNVELPTSDKLFSGPGSDVVNNNCLACHSASMVLSQPHLSGATWVAEVNKMINVYKAPVAKEDIGPIVDYLSKLQPGK